MKVLTEMYVHQVQGVLWEENLGAVMELTRPAFAITVHGMPDNASARSSFLQALCPTVCTPGDSDVYSQVCTVLSNSRSVVIESILWEGASLWL